MTATDELREGLRKRGVEWMPCAWEPQTETFYKNEDGVAFIATESLTQDYVLLRTDMPVTPAQAIAATLGNQYDCDNSEWVEWVDSLNHREVKNIRDAVEKLMHESITLGGSMGPNDIIEDGWNEGTELTKAYIDGWVETFATLGTGTCHNESEYPQMFFICSECGCAHKRNRAYVDMPRFCPNCGARVVEVGE